MGKGTIDTKERSINVLPTSSTISEGEEEESGGGEAVKTLAIDLTVG